MDFTTAGNTMPPTKKGLTFSTEKKQSGAMVLLYAVGGFGKTTFAAYAPNAVMIYADLEDGIETLVNQGSVPNLPRASCSNWDELMTTLDALYMDGCEYDYLVLDSLGRFEHMLFERVCLKEYGGDWGDSGFNGFGGRGKRGALGEWTNLMTKLQRIRAKGTNIIMLSHAKIQEFKNPRAESFGQYGPNLFKENYDVTYGVVDTVLFGNFDIDVKKDAKGKLIGDGGRKRMLYCEPEAAFSAKNRYGMKNSALPEDPKKMFPFIWGKIQKQEAPNG